MPRMSAALRWEVLKPEHLGAYTNLLDGAFSLAAPASYLSDFPFWNPGITDHAANRFQIGGWLDDRLVSSASLRLADYRSISLKIIKMGFVGAVCTHPDFSGKGFAGEALDLILEEGITQGVSVFALWGSESSLYEKRKFVSGGKQIRLPISEMNFKRFGSIENSGIEILAGWNDEILHLLADRDFGIVYQETDLAWLRRQQSSAYRTAWRGEKCVGFIAWNRGIDLTNLIHECEGEETAKRALLCSAQFENPALEWLTSEQTLKKISSNVPDLKFEYLAQFRVRDGTKITEEEMNRLWFSGFDSC
ncbi:MAG: GNAT family N-acetyltransferase [Cryobacterium sp.]|nr:GNAT family N-acetyltransferase [Oligoflexia bacterium]